MRRSAKALLQYTSDAIAAPDFEVSSKAAKQSVKQAVASWYVNACEHCCSRRRSLGYLQSQGAATTRDHPSLACVQ